MQSVPTYVEPLVKEAMKYGKEMINDLYKIIKTHSCHVDRQEELAEHIIALVASQLPGADREYLRKKAFDGKAIEKGQKEFLCQTIKKVEPDDDGWVVCWGKDAKNATLLPFAKDGYVPQVGDTLWLYIVCVTRIIGRVVEGHVFSYKTLGQENAERIAIGHEPLGNILRTR